MSMKPNKLILIYPHMGLSGNFVRHTPLSLLYASMDAIEQGFEVELLDNRFHIEDWKEELEKKISDPSVLAVGVSVMSGKPIQNAVEVSEEVKRLRPELPMIWGGPHTTFYPETAFDFTESCDYVISGYGSESLAQLLGAISRAEQPENIAGLYMREGEGLKFWPALKEFEYVDYRRIPYHLIDDYSKYGQLEDNNIIFSMYSVYGCPYKCTFCSTPAQLNGFKRRWEKLPVEEVVDHISYLVKEYHASYIYFIDDDSFVNLKHVESIIDEINRRGLKVQLGFRGARINEIKKMTDQFLDKLAEAGTNIMHIGAESGSNRILELFKKDCTAEDILECNRKLARHPKITAGYNFIIGVPTETLEDLKKTRDLILRLIEENPSAIIFIPNRFRPLPGTELFDLATSNWEYKSPKTIEDWVEIEVEGDYQAPWDQAETKRFCDLLILGSYFIDNKIFKVTEGNNLLYRFLRLASYIYTPISNWRFRNGVTFFYVESSLYQKANQIIRFVSSFSKPKATSDSAS